MCGACGDRRQRDQWSTALDSTRARWEAASLLNQILRLSGRPARVVATPGAWLVQSGTGRDIVADTLTAVWRALPAASLVESNVLAVVDGLESSQVAAVLLSAYSRLEGQAT